ncbi:MAG: ABC transporter permease [Lachnospiraceae bacterium]|nr:ABC transporter permease [Lachnospiraceae bacterium]
MRFDQRAFRRIWRKKGKSAVLFCVLFVASLMVLVSVTILQTAQGASLRIKEKTASKVVLKSLDGANSIREETIGELSGKEEVSFANRTAEEEAYPVEFIPLTHSDSKEAENGMVRLTAYDDTGADGMFAEGKYRLLEGGKVDGENPRGILVDSLLAEANGFRIGDEVEFKAENGNRASGRIVGIFFCGMERKQDDAVMAAQRIENQIFVGHGLFEELYGKQGYSSVSLYTRTPEEVEALCEEAEQLAGREAEVTSSDTLYLRLQAPLKQVIRVTTGMLFLTIVTAVLVVSLLLCMWMRSRRKEFAVFVSLGESKLKILLQVFTESAGLFVLSVPLAVGCTAFFAGKMAKSLFSSEELSGMGEILIRGEYILLLTLVGVGIVVFASGISLWPTLRENPRDTLASMTDN